MLHQSILLRPSNLGGLICNYNCNPPGAYLFQTHLRGVLIEMWGLFNLAQPMVSVKELLVECRVEKLKYKKFKVMQARIKSKSELPAGE